MSRCHPSGWPFAALVAALVAVAPQTRAQGYDPYEITAPPPPLPYYDQPPPPAPDTVWTPGYWAWDDDIADYYWVQGAWVQAPRPGYLWTPGYWAWNNGYYGFHNGYWGPHVGYYGGVDYGFGYTGYGFEGGYWSGPHYVYNRAVNNVGRMNGAAVYNRPVSIAPAASGRVSFAGGPGGVRAGPTAQQLSADHEGHIPATSSQVQHLQAARASPGAFAGGQGPASPPTGSQRGFAPGPGGYPGPGEGARYGGGGPFPPGGTAGAYRASPAAAGVRAPPPAAGYGQAVSPTYPGFSPNAAGGLAPHPSNPPPTTAFHVSAPAAGYGQAVSPAFRQPPAGAQAVRAPPAAAHTPPPKAADPKHGPQP